MSHVEKFTPPAVQIHPTVHTRPPPPVLERRYSLGSWRSPPISHPPKRVGRQRRVPGRFFSSEDDWPQGILSKEIWWRTVDFQSTDVERHTHTHQITKNPIDICYFARDFNIKLLQIIPMIFHLLDSVCHQKFLKTIVFLTCFTEPLQLVIFIRQNRTSIWPL